MPSIDSVSSQSGDKSLTPDQRREFFKIAQEHAREKLSPKDRVVIFKELKAKAEAAEARASASKAQDEKMVANISNMINGEDILEEGQFALKPESFRGTESGVYQTRAVDLTEELEKLKRMTPKEREEEYKKTKINEALAGGFGSSEAIIEGLPEVAEIPAHAEDETGMFKIADLEEAARKKKKMN